MTRAAPGPADPGPVAAHDVTPAAFRRTPLYRVHRDRRPGLAALDALEG